MYSYLWGVVCLPLSHLNELLLFLAFGFCLEYKRKAEFHKLCDIVSVVLETMFIPFHFLFVVPFYCSDTNYYSPLSLQLRTHLRNAQEHQQAQNCLKFDNQETIQCLVEVRFEQLDKAISIDLWQVSGINHKEIISYCISMPIN